MEFAPYSPRYNDTLDIKHIIVSTNYNDRALEKKECVDVMRSAMDIISNVHLEELEEQFIDNDAEYISTLLKYREVFVVPPAQHIRLLYTSHNGYTWINKDIVNNEPLYYNGNDIEYVNSKREILKNDGINDSGCFVFELSENTNVDFHKLLEFVTDLTKMKFCGCFYISCLCDVMYHPQSKSIFFGFDTESG
jgi:hypothetical protein